MAKYKLFFNNLVTVLSRYDVADIKTAIGDSTNNHRTLTVSQVIRFLSTRRSTSLKQLGQDLAAAYDILREDIAENRTSARTDAFDIYEFIGTYENVVLNGTDTTLRRSLSKQFAA